MGRYIDDGDNDYRYFDAEQDVSSDTDMGTGCSDCESDNWESCRFEYDVWLRSPSTVKERRSKFLKQLGCRLDDMAEDESVDNYLRNEMSRVMTEDSGSVLRKSVFVDEFSSVRSSLSRLSTDSFQPVVVRELESGENCVSTSCVLEDSREWKVEVEADRLKELERGKGKGYTNDMHVCGKGDKKNSEKMLERKTSVWFRRVNSISCMSGKDVRAANNCSGCNRLKGRRMRRVKVKQKRKTLKELSGLFESQDMKGHDGPILTMKFSNDGQYLASGGEDKILRVWKVVENEMDITTDAAAAAIDPDPSCLYFAVNRHSRLVPVATDRDRERITWLNSLTKTASSSSCVILPPKIFRILEKPLHSFHGHKAQILDLSWSNNNLLLSSSVDKTVCLWQLGCDQCLKIFPHSNCVTSIQFNPVNDDYFISSSLDGKVRFWEISGSRVVEWAEFKDIVTAVCYTPDGQGGIIGFMTGTCRFFSLKDKQLQLKAEEVCLTCKKKSLCKRITGFQFFPKDPSKVMVTSADSHFRIINGINVVNNLKVPKSAGNQLNACFTPDGKHIISASQDSNVYMWNYINMDDSCISKPSPKPLKSYECFQGGNAYIAVPWFGMNIGNSQDAQKPHLLDKNPIDSPHNLPTGQQCYIESFPARGSATWPEEKLLQSKPSNSMHKPKHKFLDTSFLSCFSSNAWCMVIVTAGWDGRIRSFLNYGLPMPL